MGKGVSFSLMPPATAEVSDLSCKRPEGKHLRVCRPHVVAGVYLFLCLVCFVYLFVCFYDPLKMHETFAA